MILSSDPLYFLQILLTSILGGVTRYLSEFLVKAQELDKLSLGIMTIHAIIGVFSGFMCFLVISYFVSAEIAGIVAAGLGSFGGASTLTWLITQMKKKLVLMDQTNFSEYQKIQKTEFAQKQKQELSNNHLTVGQHVGFDVLQAKQKKTFEEKQETALSAYNESLESLKKIDFEKFKKQQKDERVDDKPTEAQQEGFDELQKRQKATFIKKQKRKKQCSPPS